MKLFKTLLTTAVLFGVGTGAALAQSTDTATFNVTIEITESCTINTVGGTIDLGTHVRSVGAPAQASGDLIVNCSAGTAYNIGLNGGQNYVGTSADSPAEGGRRMIHTDVTENLVPYDLYSDAGRTEFWGNTIAVDTVSATGTGADQSLTVYAQAPSTNYPAGIYNDTVTATVTY